MRLVELPLIFFSYIYKQAWWSFSIIIKKQIQPNVMVAFFMVPFYERLIKNICSYTLNFVTFSINAFFIEISFKSFFFSHITYKKYSLSWF